jgi:predicted O-linked N-acetylglucosamine transferase (SPINDLY family)
MNIPLDNALRKYKAGDFHGVIRDFGNAKGKAAHPQNLIVIVAQSHLKVGKTLDAARHYQIAGETEGQNHLTYLLLAGNLYLRQSAIAEAYAISKRLRRLAPHDPQVLEFAGRALRETCLFDEIEAENETLLDGLKRGDAAARLADGPFSNIGWCADEAINATLTSGIAARPVSAAMQQARRARPHQWGEKLRIGYLSDDYYDVHPVMVLFQGAMASHDESRFDVTHFCYTSAQNRAKDTGNRAHYPNIVPVGHLNDQDAASLIRSRKIDILVDLKGRTHGCRADLINLGLAPVQAAYLGYPGSGNGVDCDYVISDRIVTPDSSIRHYHEKLCRLPESYQANDNIFRPLPTQADRASLGLPEDKIVFGFFNATRKITPETYRLIVEILKKNENSVLWILFFNAFARENFMATIVRDGIDPTRIIMAPKARYADHIARLAAADISLDSFPYNGHTTTSDALWAGVPVPTYRGSHFASRVSESLLTALGIPELVADSPEAYVALASELATDAEKRLATRAKIYANRKTAPLFDTARFTRHLERAFEMMADRAKQGLAPDHIDVPANPRNDN